LDVLFTDVSEAHLFAYFDNLRVLEVLSAEEELGPALTGAKRLFKLVGDNGVGKVVAGADLHTEDDREYHEPSSLLQ
jgi:hypothetical protein